MTHDSVSRAIVIVLCISVISLPSAGGVPRLIAAAPQGSAPRVVIVGLDAADWLAIDPLVAEGKLPTFSRLKRLGRTGVMVATPPLISPMIWTTIATGMEPENHGVLDFMVDVPGGRQVPVGSSQRLAPAIWNLFSSAGRRVAVVGWWATWPAEQVHGTIVSDALAPQLAPQAVRTTSGLVSPVAATESVISQLVKADSLTMADLAAYIPLTPQEFDQARVALTSGRGRYDNPIAHLAEIVAGTRTYSRIAEGLAKSDRPDLLAVYLESIDSTSHLFVRDARRGRQAINRAYQDADALLRRLADASPADTLIVVCSDHGFYPATAAITEDPGNLAGPATAWHRPYGIVAIATAGAISSGQPSSTLSGGNEIGLMVPADVAPTVLHAAGLPVSVEMPGRVVTDLLPSDIAARPPVRAVAPKFTPPSLAGMVRADSDDARDRLRALGYVGASRTSLARQNLAESLFRRGKYATAERELRTVLESQPNNVTALLWLAQTLVRTGRGRDAVAVYERVIPLEGGARDALVEATDVAIANGDVEAARRMIQAAPAGAPEVRIARGVLAEAQRDTDAAQREYRGALEAEPTSFDAAARLFDVANRTGHGREALAPIERAVKLAPDSPRHLALAGDARLAVGDTAGAERALRRALWLSPDADTVRIALGRALLAAHKHAEAIDVLGHAQVSPDREVLLGAAYSAARDWRHAVEHLQQALDAGRVTPEVLNSLGWAHLQLGNRRDAAASFNRSVALKPNQPEIRRLLAELGTSRQGFNTGDLPPEGGSHEISDGMILAMTPGQRFNAADLVSQGQYEKHFAIPWLPPSGGRSVR
jgi:tetratricopeptide (TPR) repeat protein